MAQSAKGRDRAEGALDDALKRIAGARSENEALNEDFCQPEPTPTPEVQRCIQQKLGVLFLTLMDDGSFDYDFVQPNDDMGFSLDAGTFGGSG